MGETVKLGKRRQHGTRVGEWRKREGRHVGERGRRMEWEKGRGERESRERDRRERVESGER